MQVLGGLAHQQCLGVDEPFGEVAGVRVDAFPHGVTGHVLDTASHGHVVRARHDGRGQGRHCGHSAGTPAVDRVAGYRLRQARQQCDRAADVHSLITRLRSSGDGHVVDAIRR